jgi:hypothetical protein
VNRIFRQLEEAIGALEGEISRLDRGGEDWPLFFQMLRSFRQFHLQCYREALLFAIAPCYLLETPYCVEEYVDPPRAHCYAKADFLRYSEPDWLELSGDALTGRLPRNEFGYLHPSYDRGFLGITRQTYDRLHALYLRCPARCREEADRLLLAMIDFILDYLDGTLDRSKLSDYFS